MILFKKMSIYNLNIVIVIAFIHFNKILMEVIFK